MAVVQMREKSAKIVELFKTMSYETKCDDRDQFKKWKTTHQSLKIQTVSDLEKQVWDNIQGIKEPSERTTLLHKFANLIEKSMVLICELCAELNIRKADTEKGVQLLIDYLRFYATCTNVLDEKDSKSDVLCSFDSYVYPGLLGLILGPILAAGKAIVITANNHLDLYVLLSEIGLQAGFPAGTIKVINVDVKSLTEFSKWNKWDFMVHLGYNDILDAPKPSDFERSLNIQYGKSPMIIFDSADQQAACEVLMDAVWAYNGQLPWSVDRVFVQENIWDSFIAKLKRTINQRSLDFASQKIQTSSEIEEIISEATSRGIEIYRGEMDSCLVTFIGQLVYETNVIKGNKNLGPTLTVLPFRTINEGITLANNNRQGLTVSLWGENISQVNEAARKLQVGTVWINSFGLFRPDVSFMPWKESGFGYFGGINGLLEHNLLPKTENITNVVNMDPSKIKSLYNSATSSQMSWAKLGYANRSKILLKLVEVLNKNKAKFEGWITAIYNGLASLNISENYNINDLNDYDLKSFKEPIGIIAIQDVSCVKSKELLITALLFGNVVIVSSENNDPIESILIDLLPKYVFNVEDFTGILDISHEQNIMVFTKTNYGRIGKVRHVGEKSAKLYVTRSKNVWTSVGQTYC